MTTRYDRKESDLKPSKSTSMEHGRVGGWAQVYVDGDDDEKAFGYIRHISGRRITLEIADELNWLFAKLTDSCLV